MTNSDRQHEIDRQNADFWNELCGSQLAKTLGITDNSPASLKKFDDWYFDFYPYLNTHIPFADLAGKKVLEVGLGYGTVAQRLAQSCGQYTGLDIAAGPVAMAAHRCQFIGATNAITRQGSILEPPFADDSFDWIVAIGCLHHTGNLPAAINIVHRLLKNGGQAMIMVYSAESYRQFSAEPTATLKRKLANGKVPYRPPASLEKERGAYDANASGSAAPQTEFVTKAELKQLCAKFARVDVRSENIGLGGLLPRYLSRRTLCSVFGPSLGLDLYCRLSK